MAIVLVFNVMIANKAGIETRYPGGFGQFRIDWLDRVPWCDDGQLVAVSSMGGYPAGMCESLKAHEVDFLMSDETQPCEEILSRCTWLDGGLHEVIHRELPGGKSFAQEIFKYWARGSEPGQVAEYTRILRKFQTGL